jgi:hypothetical protein
MVEILFCTNRPAEFSIPKLAEKESLFGVWWLKWLRVSLGLW